jgi:nucleoside-diphosphate-sugar epimerase
MRVFLAGATGVIGRPLIPQLLAAGHEVTALARTPEKAKALEALGVETAIADALDPDAVHEAVVGSRPEVLIHQLTALPKEMNLRKYEQSLEPTSRLREETTPYFLAAAREAGARRAIFQSISFMVAPEGPPVVDETAPIYPSAITKATAAMERMVTSAEALEGVVLRYGFFYGPGTNYAKDGANTEMVRKRRFPIVAGGPARWSFIHVDDAAEATVRAIEGDAPPGAYNIVDDDPAPVNVWLPALAEAIGAKPPRRVPGWLARFAAGQFAVMSMTQLQGASNVKAKEQLGWSHAIASWRDGFRTAL